MPKPHIEAWKDRRFGMFMHWGLYSILGEGEWAMFNKPIGEKHVIEWRRNSVSLPKTAARRMQVRSLTAASVECVETADAVQLLVPEQNRQDIDTVIAVEYDRPLDQVFTGVAPDFMAKNN